ncbi:MAG TPA: alpha/beta hydrolase [Methanocella sp.]|nr:alpha/beta hydrolase [Methanocella sp.]
MEETILIDGINVSYRVEGKCEPLILLHGMAFSHDVWDKTIRQASKFFTIYAPDLPGFGCSDKPDVSYGLDFYVEFLKKFADTLKIHKCFIAGMSMGGEIAAAFAARYPDRVDRLVIVDANGFSPLIKGIRTLTVLGSPLYIRMFNSRSMLKNYMANMLYDTKALDEELIDKEWARMRDPAYRASLSKNSKYLSTVDEAFPGLIRGIKARTLIIWGKDDTILPVDDAYKFMESIPGSEVILIERCGHAPVLEKNEAFNKALLSFLAQVNMYYEAVAK